MRRGDILAPCRSDRRDSSALCWFSDTIRDSFRPLSEMASLNATSVFLLSLGTNFRDLKNVNFNTRPSIALFFEENVSNDALEAIDMFLDNGLKEGYDKDQNET